MSTKNNDNKEHFSARISSFLVQKIKEKSKSEGRSVTSVVEEAFLQYFKDELPGLCKSCKSMNEPTDRFCNRCGKPLIEEAWEDYFNNFEEFWKKDEYLEKLKKMLTKHPDKEKCIEIIDT
jgi:predicted amidophosphoribosyltransferase